MFRMRQVRLLLIGGALAALPFATAAQTTSSTTTTTTTGTTTTTVSADKLIQKYTPLAGSEANAKKLVTGLRDGSKEITLLSRSGGTSTTTTIVNPLAGKTMGYGNVNIVLALAEKQLSDMTSPTSTDLNKALTNTDNGILTLRASGMGWGQIANTLGFKLGDVMRASAAKDAPGAAKREERQAQRTARESKAGGGRPETQRAERPERPEKIDKPQKVERPEKPQRPEQGGR